MTIPCDMWIQTVKEGVFNYSDPKLSTPITPLTIAHPLARIPRFNAHSRKPWFVAEHSILVAQIGERLLTDPKEQRYARPFLLLHDAHEAFVGDMPAPLKRYLKQVKGFDMGEVEHAIDMRIRKDLLLPEPVAWCVALIKEADIYALKIERGTFMESRHEWVIDDVKLPASLDGVGVGRLRGGSSSLCRDFRVEIEDSIRGFHHA